MGHRLSPRLDPAQQRSLGLWQCARHTRLGATFDDPGHEEDAGAPQVEAYFDQACQRINDPRLAGTPDFVLSEYLESTTSCAVLSGAVFVLTLTDERRVKLEIVRYYDSPEDQEACNQDAGARVGGLGAGHIRLRWAFLE